MNVIRLDPIIYLFTPLGDAEAHFVQIQEGWEVPAVYGCFQLDTLENWWWPNNLVRILGSITGQRRWSGSPIILTDEMRSEVEAHASRHPSSPFFFPRSE